MNATVLLLNSIIIFFLIVVFIIHGEMVYRQFREIQAVDEMQNSLIKQLIDPPVQYGDVGDVKG